MYDTPIEPVQAIPNVSPSPALVAPSPAYSAAELIIRACQATLPLVDALTTATNITA